MRKLIFLICILFANNIFAFEFGQYSSPESSALGNATVSIPNFNYYNTTLNIADYSSIKNPAISCYYQNKYFCKELGLSNLSFIYPTKYFNITSSVSHFGFSKYSEISIAIGFTKKFGKYFAIGVAAEYLGVYFAPNNKMSSTGSAHLGISTYPTKNLIISFYVYNISFSPIKYEANTYKIPSIFSLGAKYNFNENIFLQLQFNKDLISPFSFSLGFEYKIIKQFTLKTGVFYQKQFTPCLGFGLNFNNFYCDASVQYNINLGVITSIGIAYKFKTKNAN